MTEWIYGASVGLFLILAMSFFGLHYITGPTRQHWVTLPPLVRGSLCASGLMFLVRAASLTRDPAVEPLQPLEFITWAVLAWTVVLLAVWLTAHYFRTAPGQGHVGGNIF